MGIVRIEVRRVPPENTPTIRVRARLRLRLRRLLSRNLRALGAMGRAVRDLFPRRVYLSLE